MCPGQADSAVSGVTEAVGGPEPALSGSEFPLERGERPARAASELAAVSELRHLSVATVVAEHNAEADNPARVPRNASFLRPAATARSEYSAAHEEEEAAAEHEEVGIDEREGPIDRADPAIPQLDVGAREIVQAEPAHSRPRGSNDDDEADNSNSAESSLGPGGPGRQVQGANSVLSTAMRAQSPAEQRSRHMPGPALSRGNSGISTAAALSALRRERKEAKDAASPAGSPDRGEPAPAPVAMAEAPAAQPADAMMQNDDDDDDVEEGVQLVQPAETAEESAAGHSGQKDNAPEVSTNTARMRVRGAGNGNGREEEQVEQQRTAPQPVAAVAVPGGDGATSPAPLEKQRPATSTSGGGGAKGTGGGADSPQVSAGGGAPPASAPVRVRTPDPDDDDDAPEGSAISGERPQVSAVAERRLPARTVPGRRASSILSMSEGHVRDGGYNEMEQMPQVAVVGGGGVDGGGYDTADERPHHLARYDTDGERPYTPHDGARPATSANVGTGGRGRAADAATPALSEAMRSHRERAAAAAESEAAATAGDRELSVERGAAGGGSGGAALGPFRMNSVMEDAVVEAARSVISGVEPGEDDLVAAPHPGQAPHVGERAGVGEQEPARSIITGTGGGGGDHHRVGAPGDGDGGDDGDDDDAMNDDDEVARSVISGVEPQMTVLEGGGHGGRGGAEGSPANSRGGTPHARALPGAHADGAGTGLRDASSPVPQVLLPPEPANAVITGVEPDAPQLTVLEGGEGGVARAGGNRASATSRGTALSPLTRGAPGPERPQLTVLEGGHEAMQMMRYHGQPHPPSRPDTPWGSALGQEDGHGDGGAGPAGRDAPDRPQLTVLEGQHMLHRPGAGAGSTPGNSKREDSPVEARTAPGPARSVMSGVSAERPQLSVLEGALPGRGGANGGGGHGALSGATDPDLGADFEESPGGSRDRRSRDPSTPALSCHGSMLGPAPGEERAGRAAVAAADGGGGPTSMDVDDDGEERGPAAAGGGGGGGGEESGALGDGVAGGLVVAATSGANKPSSLRLRGDARSLGEVNAAPTPHSRPMGVAIGSPGPSAADGSRGGRGGGPAGSGYPSSGERPQPAVVDFESSPSPNNAAVQRRGGGGADTHSGGRPQAAVADWDREEAQHARAATARANAHNNGGAVHHPALSDERPQTAVVTADAHADGGMGGRDTPGTNLREDEHPALATAGPPSAATSGALKRELERASAERPQQAVVDDGDRIERPQQAVVDDGDRGRERPQAAVVDDGDRFEWPQQAVVDDGDRGRERPQAAVVDDGDRFEWPQQAVVDDGDRGRERPQAAVVDDGDRFEWPQQAVVDDGDRGRERPQAAVVDDGDRFEWPQQAVVDDGDRIERPQQAVVDDGDGDRGRERPQAAVVAFESSPSPANNRAADAAEQPQAAEMGSGGHPARAGARGAVAGPSLSTDPSSSPDPLAARPATSGSHLSGRFGTGGGARGGGTGAQGAGSASTPRGPPAGRGAGRGGGRGEHRAAAPTNSAASGEEPQTSAVAGDEDDEGHATVATATRSCDAEATRPMTTRSWMDRPETPGSAMRVSLQPGGGVHGGDRPQRAVVDLDHMRAAAARAAAARPAAAAGSEISGDRPQTAMVDGGRLGLTHATAATARAMAASAASGERPQVAFMAGGDAVRNTLREDSAVSLNLNNINNSNRAAGPRGGAGATGPGASGAATSAVSGSIVAATNGGGGDRHRPRPEVGEGGAKGPAMAATSGGTRARGDGEATSRLPPATVGNTAGHAAAGPAPAFTTTPPQHATASVPTVPLFPRASGSAAAATAAAAAAAAAAVPEGGRPPVHRSTPGGGGTPLALPSPGPGGAGADGGAGAMLGPPQRAPKREDSPQRATASVPPFPRDSPQHATASTSVWGVRGGGRARAEVAQYQPPDAFQAGSPPYSSGIAYPATSTTHTPRWGPGGGRAVSVHETNDAMNDAASDVSANGNGATHGGGGGRSEGGGGGTPQVAMDLRGRGGGGRDSQVSSANGAASGPAPKVAAAGKGAVVTDGATSQVQPAAVEVKREGGSYNNGNGNGAAPFPPGGGAALPAPTPAVAGAANGAVIPPTASPAALAAAATSAMAAVKSEPASSGGGTSSQATGGTTTGRRGRKRTAEEMAEVEVVRFTPEELEADTRFHCQVCNKGFQREQNLVLHRRGHNLPWALNRAGVGKRKVYTCPVDNCPYHDPSQALGDLTGIRKHFRRKHGEKKLRCERCGRRYAVLVDLHAHARSCQEWSCGCGASFNRKAALVSHARSCARPQGAAGAAGGRGGGAGGTRSSALQQQQQQQQAQQQVAAEVALMAASSGAVPIEMVAEIAAAAAGLGAPGGFPGGVVGSDGGGGAFIALSGGGGAGPVGSFAESMGAAEPPTPMSAAGGAYGGGMSADMGAAVVAPVPSRAAPSHAMYRSPALAALAGQSQSPGGGPGGMAYADGTDAAVALGMGGLHHHPAMGGHYHQVASSEQMAALFPSHMGVLATGGGMPGMGLPGGGGVHAAGAANVMQQQQQQQQQQQPGPLPGMSPLPMGSTALQMPGGGGGMLPMHMGGGVSAVGGEMLPPALSLSMSLAGASEAPSATQQPMPPVSMQAWGPGGLPPLVMAQAAGVGEVGMGGMSGSMGVPGGEMARQWPVVGESTVGATAAHWRAPTGGGDGGGGGDAALQQQQWS